MIRSMSSLLRTVPAKGSLNVQKNLFTTAASVSASYNLPSTAIVEKPLPREKYNPKEVMRIVRDEIVSRSSETDGRDVLFRQSGPERAVAGDLMLVEFYNDMTTKSTSSFAGVCMAIHRSGPTTSMTLRNVVLKVGVEQKFKIYSPAIKSITRLRPAEGFRRAKLYYLREQPRRARLGMLKKMQFP